MKKYVKIKTNTVHYIADIRTENPNISIPDDADCSSLGFEFLEETIAPTQDGFYAVEVTPINNVQQWELKPIEIQIPRSITPLQAKLQLFKLGLLDEVDTMVALDKKVQLYWEYALTIERSNDILLSMAAQLGLTEEQLDEMFIEASKL